METVTFRIVKCYGSHIVSLAKTVNFKVLAPDYTCSQLTVRAYQSFRTHGRFVPRRFVPRLGRFVPNFQSVRTQPSGRFVPNKL